MGKTATPAGDGFLSFVNLYKKRGALLLSRKAPRFSALIATVSFPGQYAQCWDSYLDIGDARIESACVLLEDWAQ